MAKSEFNFKGEELLHQLEDLLKKGNINHLRIADSNGNVLLNIPMNYAVLGGLLAPVLAVVGGVVVMGANYKVTIEQSEPKD